MTVISNHNYDTHHHHHHIQTRTEPIYSPPNLVTKLLPHLASPRLTSPQTHGKPTPESSRQTHAGPQTIYAVHFRPPLELKFLEDVCFYTPYLPPFPTPCSSPSLPAYTPKFSCKKNKPQRQIHLAWNTNRQTQGHEKKRKTRYLR